MSRKKHPNKDIEKALKHAESKGWTVEKHNGSGHCWGVMYCPTNNKCRGGKNCTKSIWSTPAVAQNHAKDLKSIADKCEDQQ